jgi:hypothetical protein
LDHLVLQHDLRLDEPVAVARPHPELVQQARLRQQRHQDSQAPDDSCLQKHQVQLAGKKVFFCTGWDANKDLFTFIYFLITLTL